MGFKSDKTRRRSLAVTCIALTLFGACSSSSTESRSGAQESAAEPPVPSTGSGDAGPYLVSGKMPAAVGGFPSVLILEALAPGDTPAPPAPPYMDQVQQTFIPPVLMVRTGQPVEFHNSDEVLHNVRVREDATRSSTFNVAIPTGEKYVFTFPRDGFYDVGCDIHPGMAAQVVASQSPYTAVADTEGNFSIPNVPTGAYKAVVYTGTQKIERDVRIASGQTRLDVAP
jgi:polysaccharide lyase family 4-like protein/copper binding plastocyanin/azurin family protein